MLRMFVTKNVWHCLLLLLTIICCHGVGADRPTSCFKHYENGTIDVSVFKKCAVDHHCCGVDNLGCCRDSKFDNPYWATKLAFRIALLVLAIGTGIKYLSRKCNCYKNKEQEHLVFVNQTVDANGAPVLHPAPNYQPYPPTATGQFQPNMATNIATQGHIMPYVPQQALSSFNPNNTSNIQGYSGPPANLNNPQQIPQNPSKTPSTTSNISTVSDSNSPLNRHAANFI